MIVVFDSDVIIPMILEASRSHRLFLRLDADGHELAISPQIAAEVREKMLTKESLRKWLNRPDTEIYAFLARLPDVFTISPGLRDAPGSVPDDPDDEKVVAAALESKAAYIVSEDRHLRDLGEYSGIRIMNRAEFEVELDRLGVPRLD
jgi:putative PIN family toxin of toxin-antitoxin system